MTVLPLQRIQCDTCHTVHVLTAPRSTQWGEELCGLGWRARPIHGRYHHACNLCADEFPPRSTESRAGRMPATQGGRDEREIYRLR